LSTTQELFYLMANLPPFNHFEHRSIVLKDRLFYDKFNYCISFTLDEITVLSRPVTHYDIDRLIDRRNEYRRQYSRSARPYTAPDISLKIRQQLHELADILITSNEDYKFNTSYRVIWLYTNSETLIKDLANLEFINKIKVSEAKVDRPMGTIKLKNPVHTHRSYFRFNRPGEDDRRRVINFLTAHENHIRPSPALISWVRNPSFPFILDYYFIDYTGESWLTVLTLLYPGLIRKTLSIIPA